MRFYSFGLTVGLACLHAFLLAPWLASFDTPVATEFNVAICIFALGAVLLHGYLVYQAGPAVNPAAIAAEIHACQLEDTAAAARVHAHAVADLTAPVDAGPHHDHLLDAVAYGMAGMKISVNGAGPMLEAISYKDLFKPEDMDIVEARRARLWSLLQCPDEITMPCIDEVLRVDMAKPGSAGSVRLILDRQWTDLAGVIHIDKATPGADRTVVAFLGRQHHAHYHAIPFKMKKQRHGGARKRAQQRRAAGAQVQAAAKALTKPGTLVLRPRLFDMAKLLLQLQVVKAIASGRTTGVAV